MASAIGIPLRGLSSSVCALLLVVVVCLVAEGAQSHPQDKKPRGWRSPNELHPVQREMLPLVEDMLHHALDSYLTSAFPHDEVRPISGGFKDSYGGIGVTVIDSLDVVAIMNRPSLFRRLAKWVEEHVSFDTDFTVSVFETNIRVLGGLLSAHFMYEEGVVEINRTEHNYDGGLLRLAVDLGNRLLPAFDSPTGIPYGSINLRSGVASGETEETSTAGGGTYLIEMIVLSRLTGDKRYEEVAQTASHVLYDLRNPGTGLLGNHINITSGLWTVGHGCIGTGTDSIVEYFLKSHMISGQTVQWEEFESARTAVDYGLNQGGMYVEVNMSDSVRHYDRHDSLASFYSGCLLLGGHHNEAVAHTWAIHSIFRHFGSLPEGFHLSFAAPNDSQEHYPLRPEHIESIYYLYRATRDPAYLEMGREIALALHLRTRTSNGFATIDVRFPHNQEAFHDTMESFMISETLKYLYLLFDECNPINIDGRRFPAIPLFCDVRRRNTTSQNVGWIFTTEAHLIPNTAEWWLSDDVAAALHTASESKAENLKHFPDAEKAIRSGSNVRSRRQRESLHEARMRHIRNLLHQGSLIQDRKPAVVDRVHKENFRLDLFSGRENRRRTETLLPYQYYCTNHVERDVERLSSTVFRYAAG